METKSKVTHPVYSLYFPEEKQEWWWLYIADRKEQTLVSMPNHVCTLKDTEEVDDDQLLALSQVLLDFILIELEHIVLLLKEILHLLSSECRKIFMLSF